MSAQSSYSLLQYLIWFIVGQIWYLLSNKPYAYYCLASLLLIVFAGMLRIFPPHHTGQEIRRVALRAALHGAVSSTWAFFGRSSSSRTYCWGRNLWTPEGPEAEVMINFQLGGPRARPFRKAPKGLQPKVPEGWSWRSLEEQHDESRKPPVVEGFLAGGTGPKGVLSCK